MSYRRNADNAQHTIEVTKKLSEAEEEIDKKNKEYVFLRVSTNIRNDYVINPQHPLSLSLFVLMFAIRIVQLRGKLEEGEAELKKLNEKYESESKIFSIMKQEHSGLQVCKT